MQVASYKLQVTRYKLQVTSYTSCRFRARHAGELFPLPNERPGGAQPAACKAAAVGVLAAWRSGEYTAEQAMRGSTGISISISISISTTVVFVFAFAFVFVFVCVFVFVLALVLALVLVHRRADDAR